MPADCAVMQSKPAATLPELAEPAPETSVAASWPDVLPVASTGGVRNAVGALSSLPVLKLPGAPSGGGAATSSLAAPEKNRGCRRDLEFTGQLAVHA